MAQREKYLDGSEVLKNELLRSTRRGRMVGRILYDSMCVLAVVMILFMGYVYIFE